MPVTTVQDYDQGKDGRWYPGEVKPEKMRTGALERLDFDKTDISEGVCFALSVWWIVHRSQGVDFWTWLPGPGPQVAGVTGLFRQQKVKDPHGPAAETWRFQLAKDTIEAKSPLKQASKVLMNEGAAFKSPGYYYVSIQATSVRSGKHFGHGFAMQMVEGGQSRYFDPNFGEFTTDTEKELMDELTNRVNGYGLKGVKIFYCRFT